MMTLIASLSLTLLGADPLSLATIFIHPLKLPPGGRLFLFFPLALCIAIVYRVTRSERAAELPWPTIKNFLAIVLGMWAIALAFFAAHQLSLHFH